MTDENLDYELNMVLFSRAEDYGDFKTLAQTSCHLKAVMRSTKNWQHLEADKQEALDMMVHKISRVLNGNQNKKDSWLDIQGYARLVSETLIGD
jgi:hypothetical protein